MKYKVGDKVKIKTWDQMAEEFKTEGFYVRCKCTYTSWMEAELLLLNNGRTLTIKRISYHHDCYFAEEIRGSWSDDMIEGLYEDANKNISRVVINDNIVNRFNLMEL